VDGAERKTTMNQDRQQINNLSAADALALVRWAITGACVSAKAHSAAMLATMASAPMHWRAIARDLMGETIAVATALGHPIDPAHADAELIRTVSMGPYRPSTVIDFEMGRPMELDAIFYEPQREARRAKVPTPRLDALCGVLRSLEAAGVRPSM